MHWLYWLLHAQHPDALWDQPKGKSLLDLGKMVGLGVPATWQCVDMVNP